VPPRSPDCNVYSGKTTWGREEEEKEEEEREEEENRDRERKEKGEKKEETERDKKKYYASLILTNFLFRHLVPVAVIL
jgi:hypothetical protein